VVAERKALELKWPNVLRVESVVQPTLVVDWSKVALLSLDPARTVITADLAPALGGAADMSKLSKIDLEKLPESFRLQRVVFQAARKAFAEMRGSFMGNEEYLVFQLVQIVERFLASDRLHIPSLFHNEPILRRILMALNIDLIVQHVRQFVVPENTTRLTPIYDEERPIGATGDMRTWYTTKPTQVTTKSHISHVVGDSGWEGYAATVLESIEAVDAYAKNDHLGFQVHYMWAGSRRRFIPDFIVRLVNGKTLALEIKGEDGQQQKAKRAALAEWVAAVNAEGGFGVWCSDVVFEPSRVRDVVSSHARA
jgi:type III restriction enzyme